MKNSKDTLVKHVFAGIIVILTLIPVWIFLLLKYLLNPEGFWQNLVTYGLGLFFLGSLQIVFIIFGIGLLFSLYEY